MSENKTPMESALELSIALAQERNVRTGVSINQDRHVAFIYWGNLDFVELGRRVALDINPRLGSRRDRRGVTLRVSLGLDGR